MNTNGTKAGEGSYQPPVSAMQKELAERGRARALESRDLEEDLDDIKRLEDYAAARASELGRGEFDPNKNAHDRARVVEHEKDRADRAETEKALKYADAELAERESAVAGLKVGLSRPEMPWPFIVSAVAVIALTISPTLHDFLLIELRNAWLLSAAGGLVIGLFIAWAIVGATDTSGQRNFINLLGLGCGVLLALGLAVLRVAGSEDSAELPMVAALTLIEIGAMGLLEWRAIGHRAAFKRWAENHALLTEAVSSQEAARVHVQRLSERLQNLQDRIRGHLAHLEDRAQRERLESGELTTAMVRAALDGYREGIAENRGMVFGRRKTQ